MDDVLGISRGAVAVATENLPDYLTGFRQLSGARNFMDHRFTELTTQLFWHHFNAHPSDVYFMNLSLIHI